MPENERRAAVDNMRTHYLDPETAGESALSVASLPGMSAAEIVEHHTDIIQKHYRWGYVSDLETQGFLTFEDEAPHALVFTDSLVTDVADPRLDALFTALPNVAVNPYSEERKKLRKKRQ